MNHTDRYIHEQTVKEILAAREKELAQCSDIERGRRSSPGRPLLSEPDDLGFVNTMPLRSGELSGEIEWCSCGACKEHWGCPRCETENAPQERSVNDRRLTLTVELTVDGQVKVFEVPLDSPVHYPRPGDR